MAPIQSKRQETNEEDAMVTVASLRSFARGMTCSKCGDSLIAPERTEYLVKEWLVLNLWSCMGCGNRYETGAFAPVDVGSTLAQGERQARTPRWRCLSKRKATGQSSLN
jgi:ribosomal protein L37AE/L43A